MTESIHIEIDLSNLGETIKRILQGGDAFTKNPLATIAAKAIEQSKPAIEAVVKRIAAEFVASDDLANTVRSIYRDALHGEAARMGRNAARAIVNAKPEAAQ